MATLITYKLKISGKVQGVWFRASAKDKALELGLKGKVWNEHDGSVGILIQGTPETVNTFIEWCKTGPPLARVEEVQGMEVETENVYDDFEISRMEN